MDVSEEQGKRCDVSMDVASNICGHEEHGSPRVDAILQPYVGMEFKSDEDAKLFYTAYAKRMGFSVRSSSTSYSRIEHALVGREFVCSKEGSRKIEKFHTKCDVVETRTGCMARIKVKFVRSGKWVVSLFHEEHNHEFVTPSVVHCLKSHKGIIARRKGPIDTLLEDRVGPSMVSEQTGGIENVGCDKQDAMNYIGTCRSNCLEKGDAQIVLGFLQDMQRKNPSFFYRIQVDKEGSLFNVFWADAMCRSNYNSFGDVITLDTTCMMNKYQITFTSIVGVNHHGQSILFGCALLGDETKESFIWLLNTFLKAMFGQKPVSLITNQDRALSTAIAEVFPESCHRFCIWHIKKKISEKLTCVCQNHSNFQQEFEKCFKESETIDEFEVAWTLLLAKFDLREDKWLKELHEDRQHWVPVYFEPCFFAGMTIAQQSKSRNAFFDGYVNSKIALQEFILQYNEALRSRYNDEHQADYETINIVPKMKTISPLEKQVAQLYTHAIFKKFQDEMFNSFAYSVVEVDRNGHIAKYKVRPYNDDRKTYKVWFNANECRANCSCTMFEDTGILCRHILVVFTMARVSIIPSHYILDRWTRKAKNKVMQDENKVEMRTNYRDSQIMRFNYLCRINLKIAEIGSRSIEGYNVVVQGMEELLAKVSATDDCVTKSAQIDTLPSVTNCEDDLMNASEADNMMIELFLRNPKHANSRCYPGGARLEPVVNKFKLSFKDSERSRTCSICEQRGHDMRTCKRRQQGIQNKNIARSRTCSTCRQRGHDMRTCKRRQQSIQNVDQAVSPFCSQSSTHDNFRTFDGSRGL